MIKCCIFDLDGTLLDTIGTITYFVNMTLEKYGFPKTTEEECKYFAGDGARTLVARALNSKGAVPSGEEFEEIFKFYRNAYDENPLYLTGIFPGVSELLSKLKNSGIKLAVLSNKPDTAVRPIVEHFFPGVFDIARGGRDGIPLKPNPEAALNIADELSISPEECAFIGDTDVDIETGKRLGAKITFGVLWGFRPEEELCRAGADKTVSKAKEISEEIFLER
jgi:phosphoglycolate phosphatase